MRTNKVIEEATELVRVSKTQGNKGWFIEPLQNSNRKNTNEA
uniref:Uncharacterized protein n=1 Tax=Rhizophora mucronata TaxID=61149 RepID=A0A2P2N6P4_RHIMU